MIKEFSFFFFFRLSEFFFYPLFGHARFRGRCWAAIRLSHRPEPSGRSVHGEVDELDIGGWHGRRFVLLRHTHRTKRRPYPFVQAGAETSNTGAEVVKPDPWSWEGNFGGVPVSGWKCGVLRGCLPTPHSIDDPPTAPHDVVVVSTAGLKGRRARCNFHWRAPMTHFMTS